MGRDVGVLHPPNQNDTSAPRLPRRRRSLQCRDATGPRRRRRRTDRGGVRPEFGRRVPTFSDSGGVQLLFSATGGEHWAAPLLLAQADPESSQQIRLDLKFEPQTGLIHAVAIVDRGVRYWAYDSEIEEVVTESLIEDLNSSASVGMVCRENKGCTRGLDVPQPSIFVGADGTVFVSYGIGEGTGAVKIARKSARNRV